MDCYGLERQLWIGELCMSMYGVCMEFSIALMAGKRAMDCLHTCCIPAI